MANGIVLNIDTTKSEFQNPMVQLRQGDGNYQSLDVTVTSNGEPFDLTGWTIMFMGTTAGGFKIVDADSVVSNAVQGEFTYTPTKAWGQDQGEFKNAYFKFTKSDKTASGASFRVNVLDSVDLTAEEADDYISVVDALIDDVKTSMDTKLAETKQTLADTQTQANTVQTNVNDLNTNVNDLKSQNNNIRTSDNTWTGSNIFTKEINLGNNISTTSDNSMINGGGNDGSLAMIKKQQGAPFIAVGSNIPFKVKRSKDKSTNITPFDVFTDLLTVNIDGTTLAGETQVLLAKDSTVLHNTGNETATGNKTFTGVTTFTQTIQGDLNGNANTANTANDPNAAKLSANNYFTGNNTFTGQTSFWFKQIPWNSGIMQGTWYIQRMGNWVNAKFDMSANTGTGTTTLTLPVGYRPLSQFVRDLEQGEAGISQNGTVLLANSYTGSNAMTFSYPTNDVWPTA